MNMKSAVGFTLSLFLVAFGTVSGVACAKPVATPTVIPVTLEPAPVEAVALTLWKEFKADEAAAMAKYADKTLHFARVRVDRMTFLGEPLDPEFYVQEGIDPAIEQVKFRTDLVSHILTAREGYIVEIIGTVEGIQFGYLVVRMSWLNVVDPPGGDKGPPPEY